MLLPTTIHPILASELCQLASPISCRHVIAGIELQPMGMAMIDRIVEHFYQRSAPPCSCGPFKYVRCSSAARPMFYRILRMSQYQNSGGGAFGQFSPVSPEACIYTLDFQSEMTVRHWLPSVTQRRLSDVSLAKCLGSPDRNRSTPFPSAELMIASVLLRSLRSSPIELANLQPKTGELA